MNFSLYTLTKAMQSLKTAIAGTNYIEDDKLKTFNVEVEMVEEDPGNGVMMPLLKLVTSGTRPSNSMQGPAHVKFELEIFPEEEKKSPKLTVTETREIT